MDRLAADHRPRRDGGVAVSGHDPRLTSSMDQAQATFGGMGTAFANCYRAMVEGGVPRHVAAKALLALVAAWATGTFTPGGTPR